MNLLMRQHTQQILNFSPCLNVQFPQSHRIINKQYVSPNRNLCIDLRLRSLRENTCSHIFGNEVIIRSKGANETVCDCVGPDYLDPQFVIFNQMEVGEHGRVEGHQSFCYRENSVKDISRLHTVDNLTHPIFDKAEANREFGANAQQEAAFGIFISARLPPIMRCILIGGDSYCDAYSSDGADSSYPIRPFGDAHFRPWNYIACKIVYFKCYSNNTNYRHEPPFQVQAFIGGQQRLPIYKFFRNHCLSDINWRNRNTQSIGGGK